MHETFDHTADLGLRIRTPNLDTLFVEAAQALFATIVTDLDTVKPTVRRDVNLPPDDREFLLFDWLKQLLYWWDAEHLLFGKFEVHVTDAGLSGSAWGEPLDRARHQLEHEVKAITYHGLRVEPDGDGWLAEVIVDIQWMESVMAKEAYSGPLEKVDDCCYRIPKSYKEGMRVDGMVFADDILMRTLRHDQALDQVANVAFLPGIQKASLAMPDIHWGYGFCIGGVCATDPDEGGVISPGGVGYDINCGVRLCRSNLFYRDVKAGLTELIDALFKNIPTGVGRSGKYSFKGKELERLLAEGSNYVIERGLGDSRDVEYTEAHGRLDGADPGLVTDHAKDRGAQQCGTLGSGNHFLEVQVVDQIFDEAAAQVMGLQKDMVCVMIHSGSRGLGYQVCDDALAMLRKAPEKYGINLPDRQLACAPIDSPEGKKYIGAMRAAANFAWCNRQLLMQQAREVFADVFGQTWQSMQMNLIYDVCHNIAKFEEHTVGKTTKRVWVHRKGATRAFPPDHPEIPSMYRKIGQPVIIPGDMGRASWVLVGQPGSMEKTFGTTCHGAGRAMSRTQAIKEAAGRRIDKELLANGIIARAQSHKGLAEEQPKAYKNVDEVVEVVHKAGLSRKVARMRPIGVIKG